MMRRRPNVDADAPLPAGGTITGIVASPRAPGRFTVMVHGKAAHTLGLAAIEQLGLAVGATTAGREEIIAREEGLLRTYDRAVMMLAARGRAAKDLERQLVRKGEPAEFARIAVERLVAEGFLDDEAYARSFVRSKAVGGALAKRRLERELAVRGVERRVITEAIQDVFEIEQIDEAAAAERLALKRYSSLSRAAAPVVRRRLYNYLAQRGYASDLILGVLARVISAGRADSEMDVDVDGSGAG